MTRPRRAARALALLAAALASARLGAVRAGEVRATGVDAVAAARRPPATGVTGPEDAPSTDLADRACAGPVAFHPARVDPVFLPALDAPLGQRGCDSAVRVQNVGDAAGRVMLWLWGAPGDCFVACRPPLAVVCSGLVGPGATWDFGTTSAGWPDGVGSAVAFSVAAGVGGPCVGLAVRLDRGDEGGGGDGNGMGDDDPPPAPTCGEYRAFRAAWDSGIAAGGGVRLAEAYGPPIVASVMRSCPSPSNKLSTGSGAYEGAGGRHLAGYDRVAWVGTYAVPAVRTAQGTDETWLSIQNAGSCCAAVDIWFQSRSACQPDALCFSGNVPPGASVRFRASDCRAAFDGSAWIRGSEPLAVVVDVVGAGGDDVVAGGSLSTPATPPPPEPAAGMATYVAPPADLRRAFDARPVHTAGGNRLFGPWLRGGAGVRSHVTVQNMAGDRPARVRFTLRAAGQVVEDVVDVCPRGSVTWNGDAIGARIGRPGGWAGDVTVVSLADPGGWDAPPNLIGVVEVRAAERPAGAAVGAAGAVIYELATVPGHNPPKTPTRLIAVPRIGTAHAAPGAHGSLVVADLGGGVGGTAFGLFVFDANGLVAVRCHRLPPFGQIAVDVATLHAGGAPFRGAALVSAAAWDDAFSPDRPAAAAGSMVALAVGAGAGADGDAWSAAAGVPLPPAAPIGHVLAAVGPLACAAGPGWGAFRACLPVLQRGR